MAEQATQSTIAPDEDVILFPAAGSWDEDAGVWRVDLHAWVFEPEYDSRKRRLAMALMRKSLDLDLSAEEEKERYQARMRYFLVDNERSETVVVEFGGQQFVLPPTMANGHCQGMAELPLPREAAGQLTARVLLPSADKRTFTAPVYLIAPTGVSVISDIDDTIKISEVTSKRALLRRTFLLPFEAVPGMAAMYGQWAEQDMAFHYLTASPWQLYPVLEPFLAEAGFPGGTFDMRHFRVKDRSLLNLMTAPFEMKYAAVEAWLKRYPERTFILVGDASEQDPEIYGDLARRHPERIRRMLIRVPAGSQADTRRWEASFRDIPPDRWQLLPSGESNVGHDDFEAK